MVKTVVLTSAARLGPRGFSTGVVVSLGEGFVLSIRNFNSTVHFPNPLWV